MFFVLRAGVSRCAWCRFFQFGRLCGSSRGASCNFTCPEKLYRGATRIEFLVSKTMLAWQRRRLLFHVFVFGHWHTNTTDAVPAFKALGQNDNFEAGRAHEFEQRRVFTCLCFSHLSLLVVTVVVVGLATSYLAPCHSPCAIDWRGIWFSSFDIDMGVDFYRHDRIGAWGHLAVLNLRRPGAWHPTASRRLGTIRLHSNKAFSLGSDSFACHDTNALERLMSLGSLFEQNPTDVASRCAASWLSVISAHDVMIGLMGEPEL